MEQAKIDRINFLARKQRSDEGLTPDEKSEQELLRREYRDSIKRNLLAELNNIEFTDKEQPL